LLTAEVVLPVPDISIDRQGSFPASTLMLR
jgi:hypothetical protein